MYPRFCKSCTGSISIIGYEEDVLDKLETVPTWAPVAVVLLILREEETPGFKL